MATLSTTLTFSSSDATSDTLKVTNTDTLTIGEPAVNIARASIATGAATNIITTANAAITYVYLKNTDTSNFVTVKIDAGTDFAVLSAGEFMLLPMKGGVGLEVQADTGACIVEYGYWTKA